MYIKIKFNQIGDLVKLSQFSGMAPCQILSTNSARSETQLLGRDIMVKIETARLARPVGKFYEVFDKNIRSST